VGLRRMFPILSAKNAKRMGHPAVFLIPDP